MNEGLTRKQKEVLRGMILAVTVIIVSFSLAAFAPWPKFMYALAVLKFDLLIVICLVGNIAIVAKHRFFSPQDIDGSGLSEGTQQTRLYQATLQNTLEQVVLAVIVHALWIIFMPVHFYAFVAVACLLFFVGRLCFWRGYANGAGARSFGFALTFYPSVIMLGLMLIYMIASFFSAI